MLFLSNEKYPVEDEYFSFLSEHGGGANAFTANTHTNYYFSVSQDALEQTLTRFALFFAQPTFDATMVQQEVHGCAHPTAPHYACTQ